MNKEDKGTRSPFPGDVFRVFFIIALGVGVLFLCTSIDDSAARRAKETTPALTDSGIKPEKEIELLTAGGSDTNDAVKSQAESAFRQETEASQPANYEKPSAAAAPPGQDDSKPKPPGQDEDAALSDAIRHAQELVRGIADTVEIDPEHGNVSYKQDDIPNYLHLTFKAEAFDLNGACIGRFVSDAGWMVHPENYDSAAKELTKNLGVSDFKDKMVIVSISMRQIENGRPAGEHVTLQTIYDYDGNASERMITK